MKKSILLILSSSVLLISCQAQVQKPQPIYDAPYRPISAFPSSESDFLLSKAELENRFPDLMFYIDREHHPDNTKYKEVMCIPQTVIFQYWGKPDRLYKDQTNNIESILLLGHSYLSWLGAIELLANSHVGKIAVWEKGNYYITADTYSGEECNNKSSFITIMLTEKNKI